MNPVHKKKLNRLFLSVIILMSLMLGYGLINNFLRVIKLNQLTAYQQDALYLHNLFMKVAVLEENSGKLSEAKLKSEGEKRRKDFIAHADHLLQTATKEEHADLMDIKNNFLKFYPLFMQYLLETKSVSTDVDNLISASPLMQDSLGQITTLLNNELQNYVLLRDKNLNLSVKSASNFIKGNMLVDVFFFLIVFGLVYFFVKRFEKFFITPLQIIASATTKMASGDLSVNLKPVIKRKDEMGEIAQVLQKLIENFHQLINSGDEFRQIKDAMQEILVFVKPDMSIAYANQATFELLEYDSQTLIGKNVNVLFNSGEFQNFSDLVGINVERTKRTSMIKKDQSPLLVLLSSKEIKKADKTKGVYLFAQDQSAVKAVYEDIEYLEKNDRKTRRNLDETTQKFEAKTLEVLKMNNQISQLKEEILLLKKLKSTGEKAAKLTPEVQYLMDEIVEHIQRLPLDIKTEKRAKKWLSGIDRASRKTMKLIEPLLGFSESFRPPEPFNLNELIQEALNVYTGSSKKVITFSTALSTNLWEMAGNRSHILSALSNIMNTQVHYIPNGGQITVKTGNLQADKKFMDNFPGLELNNYVWLHIKVAGSTLSQETIDSLFDPALEELNAENLTLGKAYRIIKNHRGVISAKKINDLTVFDIFFPSTTINAGSRPSVTLIEPHASH